jgi:hypothetical protein
MEDYPNTPTEVAKYFIMRELDDLRRAGVFNKMKSD